MRKNLKMALHKGLDFLVANQRDDGFMPSFYWQAHKPDQATSLDNASFATACIAYSLSYLAGEQAKQLYDKALRYLQSQMLGLGLWRYWQKEPMPLPPDLDDSSLCSFLLRYRNLHLRFGSNIPIILANRNQAGLFQTWMGVEQNDICPVVNANVLLYLGDRPECAVVAEALVESVVGKESWDSLYYPDKMTHLHAISRALHHGVSLLEPARQGLLEYVHQLFQADHGFENALQTALAGIVLLNLDDADNSLLDKTINDLISQQNDDGSWAQCRFFVDPAQREFGSSALTTAFCLEALSRFNDGKSSTRKTTPEISLG